MKDGKKFYEYSDYNNHICINELTMPSTPMPEEYHKVFLIYAKDRKEAFSLAMKHIYEGLKPSNLYNITYRGEYYDVIKNVVA